MNTTHAPVAASVTVAFDARASARRLPALLLGLAGMVCAASASGVLAADAPFPTRPVRIIVSAPPGGTIDLIARVLSPRLTAQMGQQFVVDNRSGAGGVIGTELVATATPDGYTIGVVLTGFSSNAAMHTKLPYDPIRDIAPVMHISQSPLALAVYPALEVKSVRDLIALGRTRNLNYGSGGNGTGAHISAELLKITTGMKATHIPYKGAALATNELVAGQVQFEFAGPISVLALGKSGRLRLIGVTSLKRSAAMPDLPTLDESGAPGFEFVNWYGIIAPGRTPVGIIAKINSEIATALKVPEVAQKLSGEGGEIVGGTPGQFGEFLKHDLAKWQKIVKAINMKLD